MTNETQHSAPKQMKKKKTAPAFQEDGERQPKLAYTASQASHVFSFYEVGGHVLGSAKEEANDLSNNQC